MPDQERGDIRTSFALSKSVLFLGHESAILPLQECERFAFAMLDLVHRTLARVFIGTPTQKSCAVPKSAARKTVDAFEKHLEQTKTHVERLEEVFEEIGKKPKGKTCRAMKGLIEEGSEILHEDGEESVIDAGIIVATQKVEHYEIASYGSVRTFAQLLGKNRSADLLQTTLAEESEANELLNNLAEDIVNPEALMEPEIAGASSGR